MQNNPSRAAFRKHDDPSARDPRIPAPRAPETALALAIIWSAREQNRAGEIAFLRADKPYTLGRGAEGKEYPFDQPRS